MIHFLVAHWRREHWIDIQLAALARVMREPYQVHAVLDRIKNRDVHAGKFASVVPAPPCPKGELSNGVNLDALGAQVPAADDDILIFIDSDAWPVVDPMPHVYAGLDQGLLVAPRREEALGNQQPHPMFCAVRAGVWRSLGATWRRVQSGAFKNALGQQEVENGGAVLAALAGRPWVEWLRVNRTNDHRVLFGVYGPGVPVVYHHGAGSRATITRWDRADIARRVNGDPLKQEGDAYRRALLERRAALRRRSQDVLERLLDDPDYWRRWL